MVQKKSKKSLVKAAAVRAVSVWNETPAPAKPNNKEPRKVYYQVVSFILFLVALGIWFAVGYAFMTLAVQENFCSIRYQAETPLSGDVVAVVDGEPIYMSEIKEYAEGIPQLAELPFEAIYPQLLDTVVNARVLKAAAVKAGTTKLPRVQRAVALAYDQIVAQAYMDGRLKELASDDRLHELYNAELAAFKPEKEIRAKHILVKTEQEAKDLIIQLKAGGDFAALAEKHSLDKSSRDGDLGYFTKDMMIPEFGNVVFKMKKGQLSEPIQTPFGWHVVMVSDVRQSKAPTFDEVKNDLRQMLMEQDISRVMDAERKNMKVKIKKPKI